MYTPNPWEDDDLDVDDPSRPGYAEHVRAASDDARNRIRDSLGRTE